MSTNNGKLAEEFQSWNGRFTTQLRKGAPTTLADLKEIKCSPESISSLLFSYVAIELPRKKKLRKDSKAFRKEVRRVCKRLLDCAREVEDLCSKKLYGEQDLRSTHLRFQVSLKEENVRNFENLPDFLRENAKYMVEFLCFWYRRSNAAYIFGPDYMLLAVQKELKRCAGKKSVDNNLADLLVAAYAASGISKNVDSRSLARRLNRLREPLGKHPELDPEPLIDYYLRQNQT